ncbi:MAG: ComEC/Rec2 family competence protein [Psychrobacter sp.]|uniref:ComEC/Rec2 family competence protein n=1 Tax=unclassified Psychrobacter TaxID=196806 RepID=UPI003F9AB89D
MYWLIGGLIIIAMMGVLAVADSMVMPNILWLADIPITSFLFVLLVSFATILLLITQFNIPSANLCHSSKNVLHYSFSYYLYRIKPSLRVIQHIIVATLAVGLVVGSALQAVVSHQQAEMTAITKTMRVQALVTIEGISDSVYDAALDSGYRQVATISYISPLTSELTPQELDRIATELLVNHDNSLSDNLYGEKLNNENSHDKNLHNQHLKKTAVADTKHRILLNAYLKQQNAQQVENNDPYTSLNRLQPGDQQLMTLALAPLATSEQALNNPSGFDSYRWLRGRHIDGVANILTVSTVAISHDESLDVTPASTSYLQRFRTRIEQGRWQLRQHFYTDWHAQSIERQQAKAVTLSLLTGDRSLISRETKDLYQLAGISHLLAISGTHVLFLAIILAGIVALIFDRLCPAVYRYFPRWQVRWWVMIGAAFIYALFTGFDVPAARTAWMLLAIGLVRMTLLPVSTMRVLFALAILMAWRDPYVLWQAGYWLSFIAVALLLRYEDDSYRQEGQPLIAHNKATYLYASYLYDNAAKIPKRIWLICRRIFKLQFWLFLTLLPITLLLFGKASLWGLLINLFAIGLFGWVIVPLNLLAGLFYLLLPAVADQLWALVSAIVAALHKLMIWLISLPVLSEAWLYTPINMAILLMVLLSILPWLLPKGFISRWLAVPPLTLLVMTVYANQHSLATTPTLYILPTGDQYISAALLQYPVANEEASDNNISWLFLADHRSQMTRTMPTHLTVDVLSTTLKQQLGSLSVNRLQGVIIQSSSIGLTDTLDIDNKGTNNKNTDNKSADIGHSELLPLTVIQLNQHLPISEYWQAGRSDRWLRLQHAYQVANQFNKKSNISVQRCEQGKTWQATSDDLSITAMTGWSEIDDASVWDCTLAIDTALPVQVLRYNAAEPLKPLPALLQDVSSNLSGVIDQTVFTNSRLVLNADSHQRVWQMWTLLCSANPSFNQEFMFYNTLWLGHSTSQITAEIINHQRINEVTTYDDKALEVALPLVTDASDN